MIAGYLARDTFLHRLPAGGKLLALAVLGCALPFIGPLVLPSLLLFGILAFYLLCGKEALQRLKTMRMLALLLVFIGVIQGLSVGWEAGIGAVLRLLVMVLLADLVTLSTTMQAMMTALQPILRPLARFGLSPQRIALAVALVLRFIPYLLASWRLRDEAYRARTGKAGGWRIIAPFIIETMHLADRVAETLDARGFGIETDKT